jgi:ligand-binding SRPBCC domain-containing protein
MRVHLCAPFDEVFTFFADAHNLERITPPFLRFSVRSMTTPAIQQGTEITFRLRLQGLPISWTSRVCGVGDTLWIHRRTDPQSFPSVATST